MNPIPLHNQVEDTPGTEKPSLSLCRDSSSFQTPSSFKRLIALFIDGFASSFLALPISFVFGFIYRTAVPTPAMTSFNGQPLDLTFTVLSMVVSYATYFAYFGYFMTRKGSTPGKMIFNMKVLNAKNGQYLTWGQVFMREIVGKLCSAMTFMVGYIMAFFRKDKRTLHDFMSGSEVVQEGK